MTEFPTDDTQALDPASSRLLEKIGGGIISGDLAPGEKLTEAELSKRYSVSRGPLREALVRLQERQLIERVPFSGTRVASPSMQTLEELYEIRAVLEGLAARRAALLATPEQVDELRAILEAITHKSKHDAATSYPLATPPARVFHDRIADIAGNRQLIGILSREIWQFSMQIGRRWMRVPERVKASILEHEQIVSAIANRDGEFAEIVMRRHVAAAHKVQSTKA